MFPEEVPAGCVVFGHGTFFFRFSLNIFCPFFISLDAVIVVPGFAHMVPFVVVHVECCVIVGGRWHTTAGHSRSKLLDLFVKFVHSILGFVQIGTHILEVVAGFWESLCKSLKKLR